MGRLIRRATFFTISVALAGAITATLLSQAPAQAQAPAPAAARTAAPRVTSPETFFGHPIGADYVLPNYTKFTEFVRLLDKESDRVVVQSIGKSAEGRDQLMAIITAPENFKKLDRYQEISRRLSLAEGLTDDQARALAREGKAVIWIDGGLHATEVLGAQQLIETIYQFASKTDEETLRILKDVVILAVHANPDGMELVSDWYMRKPTPNERSTGQIPRLYQKYVGHDNNRDFYAMNQPESTNMNRVLYREWFPQIMYNHHQTGPTGTVMFSPPFRDPFNYVYDPLVVNTLDQVGSAMHARFDAEGKPGVTTRSGSNYSTWWNGGLRTMAYFHNQVGLLTESIGNPTPEQIGFVPDRLLAKGDLPAPIPPQTWHFRQSIDYSITANYAVLDFAQRYRETLLYNIYVMGRNAIRRGSTDNWTDYPQAHRRGEGRDRQGDEDRVDRSADGRRRARAGRAVQVLPAAAEARVARCPRLRAAGRQGRLPDRDQVRQRAGQGRRHRASRDGAVRRRRHAVSGRLLRGEDGAGVPSARARHVRAAGSSRTTSSIPVVRRFRPTTTPGGRWRSRWAWCSIACSTASTDRSRRSPTW